MTTKLKYRIWGFGRKSYRKQGALSDGTYFNKAKQLLKKTADFLFSRKQNVLAAGIALCVLIAFIFFATSNSFPTISPIG